MTREGEHHWRLTYQDPTPSETETTARFFSEERRRAVTRAMVEASEPESLKLGEELRKSSVTMGLKSFAGPPDAMSMSEARKNYRPKPLPPPASNIEKQKAELSKCHIDHAYGHEKSCKDWKPVMAAEMDKNKDEKFGCSKPQGLGHLKAELRRSNVPMRMEPARYSPDMKSSMKAQFVAPPVIRRSVSCATFTAKDLRASHVNIAEGPARTCSDWKPMSYMAMSEHEREKYECEKPRGLEHLGKELRKSSVPLAAEYMLRGCCRAPPTHQR